MSSRTPEYDEYWNKFYRSEPSNSVPRQPSSFGRWVSARTGPNSSFFEFGFGNARDSLFLAQEGHRVQGYDFADPAVASANQTAKERDLDAAFFSLDLRSAIAVDRLLPDLLAVRRPVVYGRFLLHSLVDEARLNLLRLCAAAGAVAFFEFRTGKDAYERHEFGDDHYRNYIDPPDLADEIEANAGAVVLLHEGFGYAVYKTEDPHIARVVAEWSR